MNDSIRHGGDRSEGGRWRGLLAWLDRLIHGRWITRIVRIFVLTVRIFVLIVRIFVLIVEFFCKDG